MGKIGEAVGNGITVLINGQVDHDNMTIIKEACKDSAFRSAFEDYLNANTNAVYWYGVGIGVISLTVGCIAGKGAEAIYDKISTKYHVWKTIRRLKKLNKSIQEMKKEKAPEETEDEPEEEA